MTDAQVLEDHVDQLMMMRPWLWPGSRLHVKQKGTRRVGTMAPYCGPEIYALEPAETIEYGDFEELCNDGWVVD